jgi:hypothetical protein
MFKFKKLFLGGLAMLLVFSLALSATPAFAQETAPGSSPIVENPDALNLATIKSIATLLSFPPQLVINGTLPSPCYSTSVSTLIAQKIGIKNSVSATGTISIFVQQVRKAGAVCSQVVKPFSTTVSLDPRAMKLAPGSYTVLVNPVNGQSRFKTTLVVH